MDWKQIVDRAVISAQPSGLWTVVVPYLYGPALLRIEAQGQWTYSYSDSGSMWCGPDGDMASLLVRDRVLYAKGPVGALIGKIGGSTAGPADGTMFLAGSFCVVKVADEGGPVFLTINDEYGGMANNSGSLQVNAWVVPAPPAPAAAKTPAT